MIDLFSVKLYGQYDEIGSLPTINNGLFLCDTAIECNCICGDFVKGYTYQLTNGAPERVGQADDYKIKNAIYPTIQSVCEWLNNWFRLKVSCKCCGDVSIPDINTGDLVQAKSDRQTIIGYATVTDGVITLDNPLFNPDVKYTYYLMAVPHDFEKAISQMIYYDVFTRGAVDDLKSESIGNYSYSKEDITVGTLAYPKAIISGLEANYKRLRFVQ